MINFYKQTLIGFISAKYEVLELETKISKQKPYLLLQRKQLLGTTTKPFCSVFEFTTIKLLVETVTMFFKNILDVLMIIALLRVSLFKTPPITLKI